MAKHLFLIGFIFFFFSACSKSKNAVIAQIPEASGICYNQSSDTLLVANDEGSVYEISTEGKILRQKKLGDYDLEGVACDDKNNRLYFAAEESGTVLVVSYENLKVIQTINVAQSLKGLIVLQDKKHGLEGIAVKNGSLYLAKQSKQRDPGDTPSVVVKIDGLFNDQTPISKRIDPQHSDISGLAIDKTFLYMVSDKQNCLIRYDLAKDKVLSVKKLPVFAQEGVAFDSKGYIYFADDKGEVRKYPRRDFE